MNKYEAVSMDENQAMIDQPTATSSSAANCCYSFFCCSAEQDPAETNIQVSCPTNAAATAPLPNYVANQQQILHDYKPQRTIYVLEKYGHHIASF